MPVAVAVAAVAEARHYLLELVEPEELEQLDVDVDGLDVRLF